MQEISPVMINGPFSRFVAFRHLVSHRRERLAPSSTAKPLWGTGSLEKGGRYNFHGKFEVVYLAEDAITALAESNLMLRNVNTGVVRIKGAPRVHISVDGILLSVLDLTQPETQELLFTNKQELTGEWRYTQAGGQEAPTQVLGRVAFQSVRFTAIRFPSSKNPPHGVCIALFPERLSSFPPSFIAVYDPDGNLSQRIPPV